MEKSVDAFRTISEVADELDLPQHVLRFWETRFSQIRPLKRAGGRRYYRPADVVLLRNIRQLLYDDGYTIKGVQRLLKDKAWLKENSGRDAGDPTQDADALEAAVARDPDEPDTNAPGAEPSQSEGLADVAQGSAPSAQLSREELRDALAIIEDCQRILACVLGRKD